MEKIILTKAEMRTGYVGKRVRCILMMDENPVPPGTEGTVMSVDDSPTIHVMWDNGSTLGLIPGVDGFEVIKK
jgi:Domain of unknown function (DUF4314)